MSRQLYAETQVGYLPATTETESRPFCPNPPCPDPITSTDALRVLFATVNGQWRLSRPRARIDPYVAAGAGLTRLEGDDLAPGASSESTTSLTLTVGGGAVVLLRPHIKLRLGAQIYVFRPDLPEGSKLQTNVLLLGGLVLGGEP